jgi:hypothetical protein
MFLPKVNPENPLISLEYFPLIANPSIGRVHDASREDRSRTQVGSTGQGGWLSAGFFNQ